MGKKNDYEDEEMTVELELDDGSVVNCAVITILTVKEKDYIVLLPIDENGENQDGEVWFYRYSENPDDPTRSLSWITSRTMMNLKSWMRLSTNIWTAANSTN